MHIRGNFLGKGWTGAILPLSIPGKASHGDCRPNREHEQKKSPGPEPGAL